MATPVQLLQLSPTMEEGTIVKWVVSEGDKVSAGDILAEVETDKAVMEQEAFEDGVVLKLLAKEGEAVKVGSQIAVIGEEGEDISDIEGNGGKAEAKEKPAKKKEKQEPEEKTEEKTEEKADEKLQKAEKIEKAEKTEKTEKTEPKPAPKETKAEPVAAGERPKQNGGRLFASPLARKMAEEHGLDLAQIEGSGPSSRIVKRDVEKALKEGTGKARPAAEAPRPPVRYEAGPAAEPEEVPLGGMRKTIARRLVQSRQEVPQFNLSVEVDASALLAAVPEVRELYPDSKVTLTHFVIRAVASTAMRHPWIRTQWVDGKLIRLNTADISVAVAIEDGLLTPVIRQAHLKGVVQLAEELRQLAGMARDRKLTEEHLTGGVQTISNLGMYGIDEFDAIINPPESSILAVGAVAGKPVVRNGQIVPGQTFTITMGCDHRVVDGAVGATYLKDLKTVLEQPLLLLA